MTGNLGNAALNLGHDAGAQSYYAAMVSGARDRGRHGRHLRAGTAGVRPVTRCPVGRLRGSVDEALTLARSVGQPTLTAAPLAWLTMLAALTGDPAYDHRLAEVEEVVGRHPWAS